MSLESNTHVFLVRTATQLLSFAPKWRPLILVPCFTNLTNELTLTLKWYISCLQTYAQVFLARIAIQLLGFAPKWGLA